MFTPRFGDKEKCAWRSARAHELRCNSELLKVAVKRFHDDGSSSNLRRAFFKEISALSRLNHRNIAKFLGASTTSPHLCIIQARSYDNAVFETLLLASISAGACRARQLVYLVAFPSCSAAVRTAYAHSERDSGGNALLPQSAGASDSQRFEVKQRPRERVWKNFGR